MITRDVSTLVPFSESVTRIAAQILAPTKAPVLCNLTTSSDDFVSAWAALKVHGINVPTPQISSPASHALASFADPLRAMPSRDTRPEYYDELLGLASGGDKPSPPELLATASMLDRLFRSYLLAHGSLKRMEDRGLIFTLYNRNRGREWPTSAFLRFTRIARNDWVR